MLMFFHLNPPNNYTSNLFNDNVENHNTNDPVMSDEHHHPCRFRCYYHFVFIAKPVEV